MNAFEAEAPLKQRPRDTAEHAPRIGRHERREPGGAAAALGHRDDSRRGGLAQIEAVERTAVETDVQRRERHAVRWSEVLDVDGHEHLGSVGSGGRSERCERKDERPDEMASWIHLAIS